MQVNDPIADMLTRVRNAQKAGHDVVAIPASQTKIAITHILKEEGFIRNYKCIRDRRQGIIKIALKYREDGAGVILGLRRISLPGRRVYRAADKLPFVKNGFGVGIFSTSQGIMTDREARKRSIGGEYICSVF
jgi:small subunit ribosomal protein S8